MKVSTQHETKDIKRKDKKEPQNNVKVFKRVGWEALLQIKIWKKKGKLNSRFYFYHSKSQSKEPQQIQDDSLDIIFGKSFGRRLKEGTDWCGTRWSDDHDRR